MTPDSLQDGIPIHLKIISGFSVLCVLTLAIVLLSGYLPGAPSVPDTNGTIHVKILAINDFHGQLPPGQTLNKRPAGSAPVLASYIKSAMASGNADGTIIALPGDLVGASPPESGLLLDEPAMLFFNTWANPYCTIGSDAPDVSCNMVATLGNHEFDNGIMELMRKINGGNGVTRITHLADPYPGTRTDYVCANVVWKSNNTLILPPYTLRNVSGIPVAFIGAVTIDTPRDEKAVTIKDVTFLDEADSINRYIPEIRKQGIHAIVVLLHEGGTQTPYDGPTRANGTVTGRVTQIIPRLDSDVDVVLSGHTHEFSNAYLTNAGKKPVLVTQAYMYSMGLADIDLTIDRASGEIIGKSAQIIPVYADQPPGTSPDPATSALLAADENIVAPVVNRFIGVAGEDIPHDQNPAGESALGDMVADAQRAAMKTDVGLGSSGRIKTGLSRGNISWGNLYAAQPSGDTVRSMIMTGAQIRQALEQQWQVPLPPHNLIVSGLVYSYDPTKPAGRKVTAVTVGGVPLNPEKNYTVSIVDFLAGGGYGYTTFQEGKNITNGPSDIDALAAYVESLPQPVNVTIDGRILKNN